MNKSNPFLPAGELMAESQRRSRTQFKVGVFAVLAAHLMLILGLLIQGCKNDDATVAPTGAAADSTAEKTNQATVAESPTNSAPSTNSVAAAPSEPVAAPAPPAPEPPAVAPTPAPPVVQKPASAFAPFYTVKAGDTLSRIAKAHGTTVQAIKAANGLKSDQLAIGKKLKMPAGTHSGSATS